MKKISRKDLQGLRRQFPVLSKEDMKGCVGGYGNGYSGGGDDLFNHGFGGYDPDGNFHWYSGYTQEELYYWEGEWPGGWVYGLGYVNPEFSYNGDKTIYGHYDIIHEAVDWVEGVGSGGRYEENTYTIIENGQLTIVTSTKNPWATYNWSANVVVYVNGIKKDVYYYSPSPTGYDYNSPGMVPLGSVNIDLTQYHGQVRVEVVTSGSHGDHIIGYSAVNGTQVVYDEYR